MCSAPRKGLRISSLAEMTSVVLFGSQFTGVSCLPVTDMHRQPMAGLPPSKVLRSQLAPGSGNPMPGPFQSGCVEKHLNKMGNGQRPCAPRHTTFPVEWVPETEVIGNPRSSLPAHRPVEEGNLPVVGCTVQGHLEKQEMGFLFKAFLSAQPALKLVKNPDILNANLPLEMIAGESLSSLELASTFISQNLDQILFLLDI